MQGDIELLIKIIIPAILLIFWALSNLFNRENPNAQVAPRDRSQMPGARPGGYSAAPAQRPAPRPSPPAPSQAGRYGAAGNDEILIIRAEPTRPGQRPGGNATGRRQAQRGRNQGAGRRGEAAPASRNRDLVGGRLAADVNQAISRPIEIRPLTESLAAASPTTAEPAAVSVAEATTIAADLRASLTNPSRVREAFILNEILQAPVSVRRR